MFILSITESHNCTAALFRDGELVACASEERFNRTKNEMGVPISAVEYCLKQAGIGVEKLSKVVIATRTTDAVQFCMRRGTSDFTLSDWVKEEYEYFYPVMYENKKVKHSDVFPQRMRKTRTVPHEYRDGITPDEFNEERIRVISGLFGIEKNKFCFVDHHASHAAYAHFAVESMEKRRIVLTADSFGDGLNATISLAKDSRIKRVFETNKCDLGRLYKFMTLLLGMKPIEHEYKVMGLAPYAKPAIYKKPYEIFDSTLQVDGLDFKYKTKPTDMYFYFQKALAGCRFDGIAAGLQLFLEDRLRKWAVNAIEKFGVASIAFSGGVAMNVKANKVLSEIDGVRELTVPPSGGDESLAIGAGYLYLSENHPEIEIKPMKTTYLGPEFGNDEALKFFAESGLKAKYKLERGVSAKKVAGLLSKGMVVARMAGRMEFGARALGNRSIIADPSDAKVVKKINDMIKCRDFWMPFAPSILRERAADYVKYPEGKNLTDTFMTMAFDSTDLAKKDMIAALHPYDFTMRPHVVEKDLNGGYHELIKAFEDITGIGGVLNTSFNLHGLPVVCSPKDAFEVMENSDLDRLLINDLLFAKLTGRTE